MHTIFHIHCQCVFLYNCQVSRHLLNIWRNDAAAKSQFNFCYSTAYCQINCSKNTRLWMRRLRTMLKITWLKLLPKLIENCHGLLGNDFIFQQDGAPAHGAKVVHESNGLGSTAETSLTTPGPQTALTWIPLTTMYGEQCYRIK